MKQPEAIFATNKWGFKVWGVHVGILALAYAFPPLRVWITIFLSLFKRGAKPVYSEVIQSSSSMITFGTAFLILLGIFMVIFDRTIKIYENYIEFQPLMPMFNSRIVYFNTVEKLEIEDSTLSTQEESDVTLKFKDGYSLSFHTSYYDNRAKLIEIIREKFKKNNKLN